MSSLDRHTALDGSPELFDVLSDDRRHILSILQEADAPLALADLAHDLATRKQEAVESEVDHEQIRRCHIALYHTHAPKLAAAGLVEFDADRRAVSLAESAPAPSSDTSRNDSMASQ